MSIHVKIDLSSASTSQEEIFYAQEGWATFKKFCFTNPEKIDFSLVFRSDDSPKTPRIRIAFDCTQAGSEDRRTFQEKFEGFFKHLAAFPDVTITYKEIQTDPISGIRATRTLELKPSASTKSLDGAPMAEVEVEKSL